MSKEIQVGPLLGFEAGDYYTVCILTKPLATPPILDLQPSGMQIPFAQAAVVGKNIFWRAEVQIPPPDSSLSIQYAVKMNDNTPLTDRYDRQAWAFYVPAKDKQPRIAYASCNGFSSAKLARDTDEPYHLWRRMKEIHEENPFSLLLMGGDQLYADQIWDTKDCPTLQAWNKLSYQDQQEAKVTKKMSQEIEGFYNWLYTDRWQDENMSLMFASIPSIMMWDDHDIFDGWGSYPIKRQTCPVFKEVFNNARRVYEVFQMRCSSRSRLNAAAPHCSMVLQFRDYHLLILDIASNLKRELSAEPPDKLQQWREYLLPAAGISLDAAMSSKVFEVNFPKLVKSGEKLCTIESKLRGGPETHTQKIFFGFFLISNVLGEGLFHTFVGWIALKIIFLLVFVFRALRARKLANVSPETGGHYAGFLLDIQVTDPSKGFGLKELHTPYNLACLMLNLGAIFGMLIYVSNLPNGTFALAPHDVADNGVGELIGQMLVYICIFVVLVAICLGPVWSFGFLLKAEQAKALKKCDAEFKLATTDNVRDEILKRKQLIEEQSAWPRQDKTFLACLVAAVVSLVVPLTNFLHFPFYNDFSKYADALNYACKLAEWLTRSIYFASYNLS